MRTCFFVIAFICARNAIAAQGDFNGVFNFSLYSIDEGLVSKGCGYRAHPTVKQQRRTTTYYGSYYYEDLIYELEAKDGSKVELDVFVSDNHSVSITESPREIYIDYWKTVARFSNCPDNLSLKYNVLSRKFGES